MAIFVVHYTYSDDTAARDEHRSAHREFLGTLADEGVVLISGPYAAVDEAPDAALLVLRGDSAAELVELMREDPFQQQGLVEQVAVREWTPVLGAWFEGPLADDLR
ncbi:MAG TPA: YciI family protein [Ornithinimicrobium sp.]|nr:YciI family protein [Ornithinimicrobium sp.]